MTNLKIGFSLVIKRWNSNLASSLNCELAFLFFGENMNKINFCNQDFLEIVAAESFLRRQTIRETIKLAAFWLAGFVCSLLFVVIF